MSTGHLGVRMAAAAVALIWATAAGLADGFRNPPEGAAALGRGGIRLTQADDATAATHNPANMLDLKSAAVTPAVTLGYSKTTYTAPFGLSEKSEDPWTVLPSLHAVAPQNGGRWALGFALNVPYGQSKRWDSDGIFRYGAAYDAEMRTVNANPVAAMRLGDAVTAGAGVSVMWSDLKFRQGLPWMPPPAGLAGPGSRLDFEGDGYGLGANAGVTWQVTAAQRLALVYRSPVSVDYEGDFNMAPLPPPGALPPGVTGASDFETEVDFPSIAALGYGLQITDAWRVEANVEWIEHSRNESLDLDIGGNNALLMAAAGTTSIPQRWDDTWTVGAGTDWAVTPSWTVRAGWSFLPSPVPEETLSPVLTEGDTHVLSAGAGLRRGRHTLDAAYVRNITSDRTVDDPRNPVPGRYEYNQHLVSCAYTLAF